MKRCVDLLTTLNNDVIGGQAVQAAKKILWTEIGLTFKISNLGIGMHPGIRPSGSCQGYLLAGYGEDGLLNLFLDGAVSFLALPAMVISAVVFDRDFEIFNHISPKSIIPIEAKPLT